MAQGTKTTGAAKTASAAKSEGTKRPNALQQPLTPSKDLEAIIGKGQVTRGDMVSKVWEYIKKHNLQNPQNKREILADAHLKKVFGVDKVTMFEMNKHLSKHLS